MLNKVLITGVVAINDYEPNDYVLYKESLLSAFNLCDELIVVYGGSIRKDNKTPVLDFLNKNESGRFIIKHFDWPENYNWHQFSLSYAYGRSFIKSKWCLFFTVDEIFPKKLHFLKKSINLIPTFIDYISLYRLFLIDKKQGVPYNKKRILFRNKVEISFGYISIDQGNKANYIDFGRLVNVNYVYRNGDFEKRHQAKELILKNERNAILMEGVRDLRWYKTLRTPLFFINTHTLFMPEEYLKLAKERSFMGYLNLPQNMYDVSRFLKVEDFVANFKSKLFSKRKNKLKIKLSTCEKELLKKYELTY